MRKRNTRLALAGLLAAVTTVALAPAALASMPGTMMPSPEVTPMMPVPTPASTPVPGTSGGFAGMWSGTGAWGGTGMWGMSSGMAAGMGWLIDDRGALQAWLAIRTAHQAAMQAWYEMHTADLTSPAAQQALHDLWTAHWTDMMAFYEQYAAGQEWTSPPRDMWSGWMMGGMMGGFGWDPSDMWGAGYGAEWMTAHPAGMGQWMALRGRQVADATAWAKRYGADPAGTAARAALTMMMAGHRAQVKSFYKRHHVAPTQTRMRYGTGGWMGLGGMWGGWGW